jgi:hypothetical protein
LIGSLKKSGEGELDAIQIGCGHVVRYSWLAAWLRHLASHGYSIDEFSRERRATKDDLRLTLRFATTSRPFCFHRVGGQFDINGNGRITYSTFTIVSALRATTA